MTKKRLAYQKGLIAEIWALVYLFIKGYRVLSWRYKTPYGEIDVVASSSSRLIFLEVKARSNIDDAISAVHVGNQKRIENAARNFLSQHKRYQDFETRFDVLAVVLRYKIIPISFRYLDNAWISRA